MDLTCCLFLVLPFVTLAPAAAATPRAQPHSLKLLASIAKKWNAMKARVVAGARRVMKYRRKRSAGANANDMAKQDQVVVVASKSSIPLTGTVSITQADLDVAAPDVSSLRVFSETASRAHFEKFETGDRKAVATKQNEVINSIMGNIKCNYS